jgi:hypothetical protein
MATRGISRSVPPTILPLLAIACALACSAFGAEPVKIDVPAADPVRLENYGGGNRSLFIENDTGLEIRLWVADLDDIVSVVVKGINGNSDYVQRRPRRQYFIVPKSSGETDPDGKRLYELYLSPEGCRVQFVDTIAVPQGFMRLRITPAEPPK